MQFLRLIKSSGCEMAWRPLVTSLSENCLAFDHRDLKLVEWIYCTDKQQQDQTLLGNSVLHCMKCSLHLALLLMAGCAYLECFWLRIADPMQQG